MEWNQTGASSWRAEGFYDRVYEVTETDGRWRVSGGGIESRNYPTLEAAKEVCEYFERQMRKG